MEEALKDERFSHILKDPRFRKIPKNVRKIKIDKRFKNMFNCTEFNDKSKFDERGRSLNLTSSENLKKLYNVTSDSSEEEAGIDEGIKCKQSSAKAKSFKQNKSMIEFEKNSIEADETDSSEGHEESRIHKKEVNVTKNLLKAKKIKKKSKLDSTKKDLNQNAKQSERKKKMPVMSDEEIGSCDDDGKTNNNANSLKANKHKKNKSAADTQDIFNKTDKNYKEERHKGIAASSDESELGMSEEDSSISKDSDSEDSDESDLDENSSVRDEFDHRWEELCEEAPDTDEITKRLAVCNMDWDRIRADDLFTVFYSFKPPDGCIHSVKIYPSEYGLKRMEEEKLSGPPELVEKTLAPNEKEDLEDKKGSRYNREKLRQYQINRLRYYYAVVDCDTPETANQLYDQLNGMEYESSSVRFDLRFIPDDTTFDQEPISVSEKMPDPTDYKPRLFVTSALQQVKVNLTWDETDPQRRETLQKAFTDPDSIEKNIKDYLASSSEESEVEDDNDTNEGDSKISTKDRIEKYRALLQSLEEKEKKEDEKYEMEVTWDTSLKEKTEKLVKEKLEDTSNPFDEMLKKRKEERKLKKQMKKASKDGKVGKSSASEDSNSDSEDEDLAKQSEDIKKIDELYLISDSKKVNNLEEKKSKWKKKNKLNKEEKVNDFKCDILDPRFSAVYSSHEYNIDPSDPHFKSTEGTLAIIEEKQKRLKNKDIPLNENRKTKKMKYR